MRQTTPTSPHSSPVGPRKPFWRRHLIAAWAVPIGIIALVWFFVIQPRTVTTVNEDFPTVASRPAAAVATMANPAAVASAPAVAAVTAIPAATVVASAPAARAVASAPAAVANGMTVAAPTAQATGPTRLKGGMLVKVTEGGTGTVTLFTLADGSTIARLDNLQVPNGPDLRVVLRGPNGADLDLGALKGNAGNQSYPIPAGTDLTKYDTLAIFCRAAHVTFTQASLS